MDKVIVVGTNKGYGSSISQALKEKGVYVVGLSRGNGENEPINEHFLITDVSNLELFAKEFAVAIQKNKDCNSVVFVPGDVLLKKVGEYTRKDVEYTLNANLGYIVEAVRILKEVSGVKKILTFGSQFSYTEDTKSLAPYSVAKHLLKHFCELLNNEGLDAYHYCVPTTKTPKAKKIWEYLNQNGEKTLVDPDRWADPDEVAPILVESFVCDANLKHSCKLDFSLSEGKWLVKELKSDTTKIDKQIANLTLKHYIDKEKLLKTACGLYTELTGRELAKNEKLITGI